MRIFNRLLAFVVSVAIVGTCVILIVEVIAARSNASPVIIHWPSIQHWAEHNTWKATSVEVASVITAAAGLLILIPQLIRRKPARLSINTVGPDEGADRGATEVAITRKGLAVTIRGAVDEVAAITRTRVKVHRRRVQILAYTSLTDPSAARDLQPQVEAAANRQLEVLRLPLAQRVRVTASSQRGRVQ